MFDLTLVYMPVDVVLWLDPLLHCLEQLDAARPDARAAVVTVSDGRGVGDEDVRPLGDSVPLGQTAGPAGKIERPSAVLGLPGGAVDVQSQDVSGRVLQVNAVGQLFLHVFNCKQML